MTTQSNPVKPIPEDYGSITPYIAVRGAERFLDFLKDAFGAVERGRTYNQDKTIGHAEVWLGNSVVQMFDAKPNWPDMPGLLTFYVEDCDAIYQRALKAGATSVTAPMTSAWGDRGCRVRDPFGNIWWIQTHVEDVDGEEIMKRMAEPAYLDRMRIAQETFDREMSGRS